jgi:hypothetical protein
MRDPREIAQDLYRLDKGHLSSDATPEVEREWRRIRQDDHSTAFAAASASASSYGSTPMSPLGGMVLLVLLLVFGMAWVLASFGEFLETRGPRATMVLALFTTWLIPPVGIVSTLPLIPIYNGEDYVEPYLYLALLIPVGLLLGPLRSVAWHPRAVSIWRHSFMGAIFFASVAKGQLQFLLPGAPAVQQDASVFLWAAVVGAGAILVSIIVSRVTRWMTGPLSTLPWLYRNAAAPAGKLERVYGLIGRIIYAAGFLTLAVFVIAQLFNQYSFIGEWT